MQRLHNIKLLSTIYLAMCLRYTYVCLSLLLASASLPLQAATVVRCQDAQGNVFFADRCPGEAQTLETKKLRTNQTAASPSLAEISRQHPIVLYSVPECDACDLVRNYLSTRGLPVTEKNVLDDMEAQEELKERAGAYTVPVIAVGAEHVIKGYNRPALERVLFQIGYPEAEPENEESDTGS